MSLQLDLEQLRADTPGVTHVAHFNNAGAALPPAPVLRAVTDYLQREATIGGYEAASEARDVLEQTYLSIAELINARSNEIAYMDSATRAWNTILYAIPLGPGDRILTSPVEFGSNVVSLAQVAGRTGATVEILETGLDGAVLVDNLVQRLDSRVKLVAITHVPAQRGIVNPIETIGEVLAFHQAFYLVDACQSVGQLPVDVRQVRCDALTGTGRKWLRGPRGTGFLYLAEQWITELTPPTVDLASADLVQPLRRLQNTDLKIRDDIKRFETWERSFASMLGLGVAARYAMGIGIDNIAMAVAERSKAIRAAIGAIPNLQIEDPDAATGGIVSVSSQAVDVAEIKARLSSHGINTSVVHDYDGPLDLPGRGHQALLRISPHYYNNQSEIESLTRALRDASC